ncbi:hypothetical protein AB1L42_23710 [Thalassoglobus sp. JC818]|uniref:hypothetical protein n=1 Tax=Thalassoglobus sp. JC818 TaxID=3232136 RepID=UPI003459A7C6
MQKSKLILVDGMPGTGKSTLSQFILLEMRARGQTTRWWHEESPDHPLRLFFDPQRYQTQREYFDDVIIRWHSHLQRLEHTGGVEVFDVSILQNHVRSLLIFDCHRNQILDLIRKIEEVIHNFDAVFVYSKPFDIAENFRTIVAKRGKELLNLWVAAHDNYPFTKNRQLSGYTGFIAFWEEFDEISDRIFEQLSISKLRQVVTEENWNTRKSELLNYLDIPLSQASALATSLSRFEGRYLAVEDPRLATQVRLNDHCLVATVEEPTFDNRKGPIGRFREVRLIPIDETRFHVESWPHLVEFSVDADGIVNRMHVYATEDGWDESDWIVDC